MSPNTLTSFSLPVETRFEVWDVSWDKPFAYSAARASAPDSPGWFPLSVCFSGTLETRFEVWDVSWDELFAYSAARAWAPESPFYTAVIYSVILKTTFLYSCNNLQSYLNCFRFIAFYQVSSDRGNLPESKIRLINNTIKLRDVSVFSNELWSLFHA